ncbi:DUF3379 family protein [Kaarinaea lacus]
MKDDKDLHRQLNRPPVPEDLEKKIHANWQEQKSTERSNKPVKYILVAASLFGIIIGTVLVNNLSTPDDLISIAINDINKDEKQHIGVTLPVESVLKQANIHLPPDSMPIEMAKLCNLSGNKTTHIKVAGAKQGAVHLFIRAGDFDASLWQSENNKPAMPWRLIKPRNDLSVLVVYTEDMNPASVDKLIHTMFYA